MSKFGNEEGVNCEITLSEPKEETEKPKSKLKEQYLNHLNSLKDRDDKKKATGKNVSPLWATSPKVLKKFNQNPFRRKDYQEMINTSKASGVSSISTEKSTNGKTKTQNSREPKEYEEKNHPTTPNEVLHEPDLSVNSSTSSSPERSVKNCDIDLSAEKVVDVNVEVLVDNAVDTRESREYIPPPPPPPTLLNTLSLQGTSFSPTSRTIRSRSTLFSHCPTDSVAYSRATSTDRLRVLGDADKSRDTENFLHTYDHIFNKNRSQSPSRSNKIKDMKSKWRIGSVAPYLHDEIDDVAQGGVSRMYLKQNNSERMSMVLSSTCANSGPPKSLSRYISDSARRNKIF